MILAEHTFVPVLPEWVVEIQPLLVLAGLLGGVFVLWQMVLTTFEPRKRWKQFRHKDDIKLMGSDLPPRQPGTVAIEDIMEENELRPPGPIRELSEILDDTMEEE